MTDSEINPFQDGYESAMNRKPARSNPHTTGTADHTQWAHGHTEGNLDFDAIQDNTDDEPP